MNLIVREVRYLDCEPVAALMQRNGLLGHDFPMNRWVALWKENPVQSKDQVIPIGWVLEKEGSVVGYLGNIPTNYYYQGQRFVAVAAHGFVVDSECRQYSLKLTAAFFSQKHVDLLLSSTANVTAGIVYQMCRAEKIPQLKYDNALFWIVNVKGFARSVLCKRGYYSLLASIGGALLALVLKIEGVLRRRGPLAGAGDADVRVLDVSGLNHAFDDFWQRTLVERPQILLADRSLSALRWHFNCHGSILRQAKFICIWRSEKLVGYVALTLENSVEIDLKRSRIVDLMVEKDDPELVDTLLNAAFRQARMDGSHILEMIGFPSRIRARVLAGRAYQRKLPSWQFWYKAVSSDLRDHLKCEDVWYGSSYDGDASL